MVTSDKETEKCDSIHRVHETGTSRDSFTEIEREDGVIETKRGNHNNIDFGVTEEPEHMLEKDCITSSRVIEERCLSVSIR